MTGEPKTKHIVVEFVSQDYPYKGAKYYFIGASLDDILADTHQGTKFGLAKFSSHRLISLEEAEKLKLGFYQEGYKAVQEGICKSFKLYTPYIHQRINFSFSESV